MEEVHTVREVADKLKVSERTVYSWIYSGRMQALKVGRAVRIKNSEVQRMLRPFVQEG